VPKPKLTPKVNLICCNDSVEAVVPLPEFLVKPILEKLANVYFKHWKESNTQDSYTDYRHRCYWHIHKVPVKFWK
jgi:hypothetical protein